MHDAVRGGYPYASVSDAFKNQFFTKQNNNENVLHYDKCFKQRRDIVKSYMGDMIFYEFVEKTPEYRNEEGTDETKEALKNESFNIWCAFTLIKSFDQAKYGGLINNMYSQYTMWINQFPKSVIRAIDIMSNYKCDNARKPFHKKYDPKKPNKPDHKNESSFPQTGKEVICYCCCKKGHCSPECPKRNKRKKEDWALKKGVQHIQNEENIESKRESTEKSEQVTLVPKPSSYDASQTKRIGWSGLQLSLLHGSLNTIKNSTLEEISNNDDNHAAILKNMVPLFLSFTIQTLSPTSESRILSCRWLPMQGLKRLPRYQMSQGMAPFGMTNVPLPIILG